MKSTKDIKELETNKKSVNRRQFIKKAVYTAPKVLVLGSMIRPTHSKAAGFGPPPEGPNYPDGFGPPEGPSFFGP